LNMSVFELWKLLLLWSGIGIVSKLTSKRVMLEVTMKFCGKSNYSLHLQDLLLT